MIISYAYLEQLCLVEIDKFLRPNGKKLDDFGCLPKIVSPVVEVYSNVLLANELSYDRGEMLAKYELYFKSLNTRQLSA